jgi:hypothetical protein
MAFVVWLDDHQIAGTYNQIDLERSVRRSPKCNDRRIHLEDRPRWVGLRSARSGQWSPP